MRFFTTQPIFRKRTWDEMIAMEHKIIPASMTGMDFKSFPALQVKK
jgi:hypothetical protein